MKKSLFLLALIILSSSQVFAVSDVEKSRKAIIAAKWAEGKKVSDYTLLDQDGKSFKLNEYQGKPLLVTFIYTTCPTICSSIVSTLYPAVEEARKEFGDVFNSLVIGFDHENDTPEMLRAYGEHHDMDFNIIRFAGGDQETMERMTKDFGFFYEENEDDGYDHIGLVSMVNARGVIYKQVYGIKVKAEDIKVPLRQLLTGNIPVEGSPTLMEQIKAMCYTYDPKTGGYVLDYSFLVGMGLTALLMFIIITATFWDNIKNICSKIFGRKI